MSSEDYDDDAQAEDDDLIPTRGAGKSKAKSKPLSKRGGGSKGSAKKTPNERDMANEATKGTPGKVKCVVPYNFSTS